MSKLRLALLAATLIAAPCAAWAQVPCPEENTADRRPDSPPIPTIVAYTLSPGAAQASPDVGNHAVSVEGGMPGSGDFRIDIRLSQQLPTGCMVRFHIIQPGVANPINAAAQQFVWENLQPTQDLHPGRRVAMRGNGTNLVSMSFQTTAAFKAETVQAAILVSGVNTPYPFTLTRRPISAPVLSLSSATTLFGDTVDVALAMTATPPAGAVNPSVVFAVKPDGVGGFRKPNSGASPTRTLNESLDPRVTPSKAVAVFVPAAVSTPTTATITATLMGNTYSRVINIRGVPKPCAPRADWEPSREGLKLTVTNNGELPCPAMEIVTSATNGVVLNGPARTPVIAAAPEETSGLNRSQLQLAPRQEQGWSATFIPVSGAPADGFEVTLSLRPLDGTFPTKTLKAFAVPPKAMVVMKPR